MLTEQEFHQIADRHLDMVYRLALNWLRSPADAEDAAQNAMLRLWQTNTQFQGEDHVKHWLVRVTINECKRIALHPWRKRSLPLDEAAGEPVFDDPDRGALFQAVMDLPEKYRVPLYLYYYEGYSLSEVGELLGLKAATVETRLGRARAKLKTMLTEE